jgi:hydrogenase maturation protease
MKATWSTGGRRTEVTMAKVLIIGYGNPGRLDDGLGPALAETMEKKQLDDLTVDANYQLTVEDASEVAEHDVVVFADAAIAGEGPYWVKRIYPGGRTGGFSTHSLDPYSVLGLAKELFQAEPRAYLMGIRGYEFDEFGERLSEAAQANLAGAVDYLEKAVRQGEIREIRRAEADAVAPEPK